MKQNIRRIFLLAAALAVFGTGCAGAGPADTTPEAETPAAADASGEETESGAERIDFTEVCETYLAYIGTHLRDRSLRDVGAEDGAGADHDAARDWIVSEIRKAGYGAESVRLLDFTAAGGFDGKTYAGQNIELTVPGREPERQIVVGAHYDGDGLGDNGSGVALLLGAVTALAGRQPLYTVRCVFFDGEENGMLGSGAYAQAMSDAQAASTVYMVNIDAIAFGDYCNLYGGVQDDAAGAVSGLGAYDLAVKKARALGFRVCTAADLDGYYAAHGRGPAVETDTLCTNPWTAANPAPENGGIVSPTTLDVSDHAGFKARGIEYVYLEATNWYARGDGGRDAYTGYFDTGDAALGENGMFMNTPFDTLDELQRDYPGRSEAHFRVYSPLLASLLLNPASEETAAEGSGT